MARHSSRAKPWAAACPVSCPSPLVWSALCDAQPRPPGRARIRNQASGRVAVEPLSVLRRHRAGRRQWQADRRPHQDRGGAAGRRQAAWPWHSPDQRHGRVGHLRRRTRRRAGRCVRLSGSAFRPGGKAGVKAGPFRDRQPARLSNPPVGRASKPRRRRRRGGLARLPGHDQASPQPAGHLREGRSANSCRAVGLRPRPRGESRRSESDLPGVRARGRL